MWRVRTLRPMRMACMGLCLRARAARVVWRVPWCVQWLAHAYSTTNYVPIPHLRNIAIVAHVDHGKTTLVDMLLREASGKAVPERVMDSNDLERERGITILAKVTSLLWRGVQVNIVDTPGHADFGGEVERILSMVDGVLLLVDATEGPKAQTKFVLSKALKAHLRPLVLLNKCDRPTIRPVEVHHDIFDLFAELDAHDDQLDFPVVHASAKEGWAVQTLDDERKGMAPLLDKILEFVPPPLADPQGHFKLLVSMIENDNHFGRILTGRVHSGRLQVNQRLIAVNQEGECVDEGRILKIMCRRGGLERADLKEAGSGNIVSVAGLSKAYVSHTLCPADAPERVPARPIDPPTIAMTISANDSPLAGRDGTQVNSRAIRLRLTKEAESNVAIRILENKQAETWEVGGRGELQLGILLESMRREGFELCVSPPRVVFKEGENGRLLEPIEEVFIELDDEYRGKILERMAVRRGDCVDVTQHAGKTRLVFRLPARGLIGLQNELLTETRGTAVMHHLFHSYQPHRGVCETKRKGVMIATGRGIATSYALAALEPRGILFIGPQTDVYGGMIVGEVTRDNDLEVNPCRAKELTNVRTHAHDEAIKLRPPRKMGLEEAITYIRQDEMIEVTPKNIRLRKARLSSSERKRFARRK